MTVGGFCTILASKTPNLMPAKNHENLSASKAPNVISA